MGIISACQISCHSLLANVSVIGKAGRLLLWHGRHVSQPVSEGRDATPQPQRAPYQVLDKSSYDTHIHSGLQQLSIKLLKVCLL